MAQNNWHLESSVATKHYFDWLGGRMPPRKNSKKAAAHKKRTRRRTKSQNANHRGGNKRKDGSCPIVGIGGSAGGFEAAMELLRHLPPNTGMAFVIVQNLNPHHGSRLPRLLGKVTAMPLIELTETRSVHGDHPSRHLGKERQLCG
jgi:chemotaxis response regulator CheB